MMHFVTNDRLNSIESNYSIKKTCLITLFRVSSFNNFKIAIVTIIFKNQKWYVRSYACTSIWLLYIYVYAILVDKIDSFMEASRSTAYTIGGQGPLSSSSINFEKIEDILDFTKRPSETTKPRPPLRRKIIASEPATLLELKPILDNYVGFEEQSSDKGKSNRRYRCFHCGYKFIRFTHLRRHMRIHTGDKPYSCEICRKRFARSDYKLAHSQSHYSEKLHCCCICGFIESDMEAFIKHCRLHDEDEFIREAFGKAICKANRGKAQVVEESDLTAGFSDEIEDISCIRIDEVENTFEEEPIMCVENPIYSYTVSTDCNDPKATSSSQSLIDDCAATSPSQSLIVSINIKHFLQRL